MATKTINASESNHESLKEIVQDLRKKTMIKNTSIDDALTVMIGLYWTAQKHAEPKPEVHKS